MTQSSVHSEGQGTGECRDFPVEATGEEQFVQHGHRSTLTEHHSHSYQLPKQSNKISTGNRMKINIHHTLIP